MTKKVIEGVFTPMVTPFRDERIIFHGIAGNVEKMNESRLAGYFVLGTNGEYKSLSVPERFAVLKTVLNYRAKDKKIMAGMGFESVSETIENTLRAVDMGVDMVSLLMPHFFAKKITAEIQAAYILEVADASPVPVVLYNNPSVAANVTIRPETLNLVKDHPNVIGIKDSSSETWRENLAAAKDSLCVLSGSANYFYDLMKNGGSGGVLSLANVFPKACADLYVYIREGKIAEADALNEKLVKLNKEVSGTYGVAGVKAAMDITGLSGGVPRRPLKGLTADQVKSLTQIMKSAGLE
jgi:4-hydroxy-2-oxoglutarate aldolase